MQPTLILNQENICVCVCVCVCVCIHMYMVIVIKDIKAIVVVI